MPVSIRLMAFWFRLRPASCNFAASCSCDRPAHSLSSRILAPEALHFPSTYLYKFTEAYPPLYRISQRWVKRILTLPCFADYNYPRDD
nr:MAG TPA: hypothetical protein [Caudoviricetes sp.]